jgi:Adaptin C-terminal domain
MLDLFGDAPSGPALEVFLHASQCSGLQVSGAFTKSPLALQLSFSNQTSSSMSDFAIQFNVNSYGISPSTALSVGTVAPGGQVNTTLALNRDGVQQKMEPVNMIQIAIKNNVGVYYFSTLLPGNVV